MKGGKTIKLLLSSDSQGEVREDHNNNIKTKTESMQTNKYPSDNNGRLDQLSEQHWSQLEQAQLQIETLIKENEKKYKRQVNQLRKQRMRDEVQLQQKQATNMLAPSFSQTQSINRSETFKVQKIEHTVSIVNFNASQYEFKPQSKTKVQSQLMSGVYAKGEHGKQTKGRIIENSLIATQQKINTEGINVYFPYSPYDLQVEYMSAVIRAISAGENGLLESPTGTGKTLCLLSSVLSWVDNHNSKNDQKVNVIYCSRTHTQLRQVQSELQKTCFRPTISNFGSRDQFCIKPQFQGIKGRDLMQSCSKAVKMYLKSKQKQKLELDEQQSSDQVVDAEPNSEKQKKQKCQSCSFFKSQGEYISLLESRYQNKIITSQQIKEQGLIRNFCPYYYAFQIKQRADLIFMPYNYILDVDRISAYESIIKRSIIIFDEGHNVPQAACEGRSFEIYSNIFNNIETELKKLEHSPHMSQELKEVAYIYEPTRRMLSKQIAYFQTHIDTLAQKVLSSQTSNQHFEDQYDIQQVFKPDQLKRFICQWFSPIPVPSRADWYATNSAKVSQIQIKTIKKLENINKQINDLIEALKETYDGIFQNIQKLNGFLTKCKSLLDSDLNTPNKWLQQITHYRLSVKGNVKQGRFLYEVKLVCLTPSLTFDDILKLGPRSILLTSGTLTPLSSWEKQLKLKFNIKLSNKHVIERDQLHLGIVGKSLNDSSSFNFSYSQLQKHPNIYRDLARTIIHVSQKVPNGILAIFPSYRILKKFKEELSKDTALLSKLQESKHPCFEDKGTIEYIIMNFKNKAKTKKGAILFCVCRGKVSEGLDFSDELCRAVIFVGVPYPNIKDPILNEKREYYDKLSQELKKMKDYNSLTGDQWYTLNTMRAVNQGIGRVIRHINDYGLILMMDIRYDSAKLKALLPAWATPSMMTYNSFNDLDVKLKPFYDTMQSKFPSKEKQIEDPVQSQFSTNFQNIKLGRKQQQARNQSKEGKEKKKNYFEIMMMQAKRNSKGKKNSDKIKQLDFL